MINKFSDLPSRIFSSLVLAGAFGIAFYWGAPFFHGLVAIFWVVAIIELLTIIHKMGRFNLMSVAALVAISLSVFFIIQIFNTGEKKLVLHVIFIVITSDIGAYMGGRIFGGVKLWPRISPNKTWAGAICALIAAGFLSCAFVFFFSDKIVNSELFVMAIVKGFIISIVAQMGDIFESALKRQAGVKDSSAIIVGHGGVLDRFDGMIAAFLFVGLWMWIFTA